MRDTWETIDRLVEWLDAESGVSPEMARLLRVLKISEEAGEVAEAIHGVTGSNPRKGNSHTWDDVQAELCDVIFTAWSPYEPSPQKPGKSSPNASTTSPNGP